MKNWPEWTKQIPGIGIGFILGVILFLLARQPNGSPVILAERPTQSQAVAYIIGEVMNPGVYEFQPGSRVEDLIILAGGPTDQADLSILNLAALVTDGQKITVPAEGDLPNLVEISPKTSVVTDLIDINTANIDELMGLPGIGPDRANAIIAYRTTHGGFKSIDEIREVDGIGEITYEQIKPLITIASEP